MLYKRVSPSPRAPCAMRIRDGACRLLVRLLGNDLPTGGEQPELVGLDEGLTPLGQPLHQDVEVLRDQPPTSEQGNKGLRGLEEELGLFHEGPLVAAIFARLLAGENLETGLPQGHRILLRIWCLHRTDDSLHLTQELPVMRVIRVVGRQLEPIEERYLRARLQHTIHLLEKGYKILGIGQGLHMVQRIKGLVGKRQGVVVVAFKELELAVHVRRPGKFPSQGNLGLVDVQAHHIGARVAGHMVGDATAAATDIEHLLARPDVELVGHALLLPQHLVAEDAQLEVHYRRDVHLLDFAERAQVVQYLVVVHDILGILRGLDGLLVEDHIRAQKVVDMLLWQCQQRSECRERRRYTVP
mmetsp:Transcript_25547/g.73516  ORF Transcript_25547/g.73516 Transcript_25547/m.73516 type:complete len:356 (+) Transcript_25547:218-1285(+)